MSKLRSERGLTNRKNKWIRYPAKKIRFIFGLMTLRENGFEMSIIIS